MPNSDSPHSRALRARTASTYNEAVIAAGGKRLTVLLPPPSAKELEALLCVYGTIKAALVAAIHHEVMRNRDEN